MATTSEIDERRRDLRRFQNLPLAIKNADHFLPFDDSGAGRSIGGHAIRTPSEWLSPLPYLGLRNSRPRSLSAWAASHAAVRALVPTPA
ncbi:hypothetical protein ACPOL_4371 [Acidisarcina polymorpha]|uniref:Uncharacterized protein n=1 Tax=Acidisarcina polymorpha TaxID=2211140 RepID=A0A2Z5G495_9BACT|nr:hypothetical protein [Acidisarcina polymorpha]AXC13644.1 hypothetical protein ACPOL_4371 [Acidisarcina polymorpha]